MTTDRHQRPSSVTCEVTARPKIHAHVLPNNDQRQKLSQIVDITSQRHPLLPFVVHFSRILSASRTWRSARVHASSWLNCSFTDASPILSSTILTESQHTLLTSPQSPLNALMWEIYGRVLRADLIYELLQAVQERHHGKVEPPIVQQTAKMQVT